MHQAAFSPDAIRLGFRDKLQNPLRALRMSEEPMLIIYDVLGHFPKPRDHLGPSFCANFDERSKNGFLFSRKGDLVLTSLSLNPEHKEWLRTFGLASGDAFEVPSPDPASSESFVELFLKDQEKIAALSKEVKKRSIRKIFSWMNSENERQIAKALGIGFAWNSLEPVLKAQFNKISFKRRLQQLNLPTVRGFDFTSTLNPPQSAYHSFAESCLKITGARKWIARPAHAAAGSGIFSFGAEDMASAFDRICSGAPAGWLVEEFLDHCRSINLHYLITGPGQFKLLGISEQILREFLYSGNQGLEFRDADPAIASCLSQCATIARDISLTGYTGLIGPDFILSPDGRSFAIENNIRINGSTFSLSWVAEWEQALQTDLSWRFEKVRAPGELSFSQIVELLEDCLLVPGERNEQGTFIQEYNVHNGVTEIAITTVAPEVAVLEKIRSTIIHRLDPQKGSV